MSHRFVELSQQISGNNFYKRHHAELHPKRFIRRSWTFANFSFCLNCLFMRQQDHVFNFAAVRCNMEAITAPK